MLVLRHRLVIAGVITATALAVPAAALASGSGSSPGKPGAAAQACAASACKPTAGHPVPGKSTVPSQLAALAAAAGISTDRLQAGLTAVKRAGGNTPAGNAAFAASAGVPQATAQRIVRTVFGTTAGKDRTPGPAFAAALASQLGVSTSAAQRAVNQLEALDRGGIDPASPAFAAIARDLGVSAARLAAALAAAKQSEAGK
ncbi:MAG: hypothetical protein JWM19_1908 [Actinomycetia bacterium]|nr:hypothetical protein [Actinomycetes bacterium]